MSNKYFLGCVIPGRLPYLEVSARKTFEKLGIEISDQAKCSCCPDPTGTGLLDHQSWLVIGARNLCLYEESKSDIVSLCSGCTESLQGPVSNNSLSESTLATFQSYLTAALEAHHSDHSLNQAYSAKRPVG